MRSRIPARLRTLSCFCKKRYGYPEITFAGCLVRLRSSSTSVGIGSDQQTAAEFLDQQRVGTAAPPAQCQWLLT